MWRNFVAMGDSFTEGKGDDVGDIRCLSWVNHFSENMKKQYPDFSFTNLATSGLVTQEVYEQQFDRALALKPDLVSIITGGNDIMKKGWNPDTYRKSLSAILDAFKANGTTIILGNIADFALTIPVPKIQLRIHMQKMTRELNTIIAELSDQYDTMLLDFFDRADSRDLVHFSSDFVHPNALGYINIGKFVYEEVHRQTR